MVKYCKDCRHFCPRFIEHCGKTIIQRYFDTVVGKSRYNTVYPAGVLCQGNKDNQCEYYEQSLGSKVWQYLTNLLGIK